MLILYSVIAFLLAITVHEFMHAWTANYLGDSTPKNAGRVSLSPIPHIDPFGTLLLPGLLILLGSPVVFGYAKPVPINPNNFKNPRLGSALTAVAGPIANFLLAALFAVFFRLNLASLEFNQLFFMIIEINLILMIFNLIPIPPLDGSKFFALFFPQLDNPKLELYGPFILLILLYFRLFNYLLPLINIIITRVFGININIFY